MNEFHGYDRLPDCPPEGSGVDRPDPGDRGFSKVFYVPAATPFGSELPAIRM